MCSLSCVFIQEASLPSILTELKGRQWVCRLGAGWLNWDSVQFALERVVAEQSSFELETDGVSLWLSATCSSPNQALKSVCFFFFVFFTETLIIKKKVAKARSLFWNCHERTHFLLILMQPSPRVRLHNSCFQLNWRALWNYLPNAMQVLQMWK